MCEILSTVKKSREEVQILENQYIIFTESLDTTKNNNKQSISLSYDVGLTSEIAESYKKYAHTTAKANLVIKKQEKTFMLVIAEIERMESNRIELTKNLLMKHLKLLDQLAKTLISNTQHIESEILKISSKMSLQKSFFNDHLFHPIMRIPYINCDTPQKKTRKNIPLFLHSESTPKLLRNNKWGSFLDSSRNNVDLAKIFDTIKDNRYFTEKERANLANLFNSSDAFIQFSNLLDKLATNPIILKRKAHQSLIEVYNTFLTNYTKNRENNPRVLNSILLASRKIMNEEKEFLYSEIFSHYIWQDMELWRRIIDDEIEIECTKEVNKKTNKLGDFFNKMKTAVTNGMAKILQAGNIESSNKSAIDVLNTFTYYLSNPCINTGKVLKLYKEYGRKYGISKERLSEFELDLRQCQRLSVKLHRHLYKEKIKKAERYGNERIHILAISVKFIGNKIILRSLLLLSRSVNKMMRVKIYRQVLIKMNVKMNIRQRLKIWLQILDLVYSLYNYRISQRLIMKH